MALGRNRDLVLGLLLLLTVAVLSFGLFPGDLAGAGASGEAAAVPAALTRPPAAEDAPPAQTFGLLRSEGLTPASMRLLRSTGETRNFGGVNDDGKVCLVTYMGGKDWVAASTCADLVAFGERALPLITFIGDRENVAVLAPDGYSDAQVDESISKLERNTYSANGRKQESSKELKLSGPRGSMAVPIGSPPSAGEEPTFGE